jgi:hypothetical protein
MTDEELIKVARKRAEFYSAQSNAPVQVTNLPKVRLREAVVVSFENESGNGRIEIALDKESGELVYASLMPAKACRNKVRVVNC